MTQSTEWPDLKWIPPKDEYFTRGRTSLGIKFIVIHHTAGGEDPDDAEAGARYNQTRPDNVSSHYYVDSSVEFVDAVVHQVLTKDTAHTTRRHGSAIGISYELCGTLQTREQWLDVRSRRILRHAAKQIVRDLNKHDIPFRKMTVAQTRAAYYGDDPGGITSHANCTLAFPEDNGTHMDPGPNFPWDVLFADIEDFLNGETDMQLTDPVYKSPNGETRTVGAILTAIDGRSWTTMRSVESLIPRLNAIQASADDDGDVTVVMDDAARAELAAIRTELSTLPAKLVGELAAELDD